MKYHSTRNHSLSSSLSKAILSGLAPDGGLYVPNELPKISIDDFDATHSFPQFACQLLQPFFENDALATILPELCQSAFNFEVPLKKIKDDTFVLELFHGPTLSFKDFGARFLAGCMTELAKQQAITIMVATSGDTGSAVAAAFHQKPNIRVIILFPQGKITERQEKQITCWGDNVTAYAVEGVFDDCQHLVKSAFAQESQRFSYLSTANSINIARLLPQMTYYAYWSLHYFKQYQQQPGFIVPSGNYGNVTATFWAKAMGFPIGDIVLATNANCVIEDYLTTGEFTPRKSVQTLANAMDVGNPSNFERLRHLFGDFATFKQKVQAYSVSDEQIKQTIATYHQQYGYLICPHTATACYIQQQLNPGPWIMVATADPCKFETVIEPIIQKSVPVAPQLVSLLTRPNKKIRILPELRNIV